MCNFHFYAAGDIRNALSHPISHCLVPNEEITGGWHLAHDKREATEFRPSLFFSSLSLVIVFATCCVCVCVFHSPNEKKVWCCGCVYYILHSCLIIFTTFVLTRSWRRVCVSARVDSARSLSAFCMQSDEREREKDLTAHETENPNSTRNKSNCLEWDLCVRPTHKNFF